MSEVERGVYQMVMWEARKGALGMEGAPKSNKMAFLRFWV
jgi:hypothetical protein